jgi:hypothetical protein
MIPQRKEFLAGTEISIFRFPFATGIYFRERFYVAAKTDPPSSRGSPAKRGEKN